MAIFVSIFIPSKEVSASLESDIRHAVVQQLTLLENEDQQKTKNTSETPEQKQREDKTKPQLIKDNKKTLVNSVAVNKDIPVEKKEKKTLTTNKPMEVAMLIKNEPSIIYDQEKPKRSHKKKKSIKKKTVVKPKITAIGWIYLGRFTSGHWENPTLASKKLPKVKQYYKILATSVNVRNGLPKKDELGELVLGESIKKLVRKQEVALLQLRRSGKSNHYWAKIGVMQKRKQ